MFREFEEPSWLMEWWEKFGLNPVGVNPEVSETAACFHNGIDLLNSISDLYSEEEFKDIFIQEKYPWVLRTNSCLKKMKTMNLYFYDKYILNIGIHITSI
jgi:hypothetical protein